ncbi:MAG: leucine-rich repeat domain-containing protein, partial [Clostridia bacterium]|nr:leucine-rich repeat domain-containing protein [Clostridia bacterium]
MASLYKQKQKRKLIAAIVCCVLVFAMIVSTIVIGLVHKASLYEQFEDGDFAAAIAESLGLSSRYSLDMEDLDRFEGLVYFCNVGIDSANGYASYAYPVVMLCDKTYTDALIEQSNPDYEAPETEDESDYSENIVAVPYVLTDPSDLNMFRNLRLLRAFDVSEINEMSQNCYTTQLYNMYGLGTTAYNVDTLIEATKLSGLTSLEQISSLTKLEHLSLCYTGITNLDGIANFPNLQKLDTTYTALEDISALKDATNLTYLSINSINVTETEDDHDHDHDHDHSDETSDESEDASADTSADTSADSSADTSDESSEESEEEKKEPTYNETGLTSDDLAVLSELKNLVYLDITNNNVTDLSALSSLQNIKYLSVANNPITSLKGTEGLKNMKVLYAIDCRLESIEAVKGIDTLETVYLSNNLLTDLSALSSATKVTHLDASENELTDASAVAGMTELATLVLNGNKLTAAPDLSGLDKVTSVDLSDNEITDVTGLEKFDPTDFEPEKDKDGKDKELDVTITLNLSDNKIENIKLSASLLTSLNLSENALVS